MFKKKIVFRADGNSQTGLGHLYRLFALVEMYKGDYEFVFITKVNSTLKVIPQNYNFQLIPDKITIEEEPKWLLENFEPKEHIVIADGYQFVSSYQNKIKKFGYKLIYIDDLTTEYMYADVVVNHSPGVVKSDYKSEEYTQFALGTNYALLRPSFLSVAKKQKTITSIDTVFINFGGADSNDLTKKTIKALLKLKQIVKINVVFGAVYGKEKATKLKEEYKNSIQTYSNLSEKELLRVMQSCNFAIAPSSTILFELFCVKIPIYSGYFAKNQKNAFKHFKKLGLIGGFGNFDKINDVNYRGSLQNFINLSNHDISIGQQEKLFDGNQKNRYLSLIKSLL